MVNSPPDSSDQNTGDPIRKAPEASEDLELASMEGDPLEIAEALLERVVILITPKEAVKGLKCLEEFESTGESLTAYYVEFKVTALKILERYKEAQKQALIAEELYTKEAEDEEGDNKKSILQWAQDSHEEAENLAKLLELNESLEQEETVDLFLERAEIFEKLELRERQIGDIARAFALCSKSQEPDRLPDILRSLISECYEYRREEL